MTVEAVHQTWVDEVKYVDELMCKTIKMCAKCKLSTALVNYESTYMTKMSMHMCCHQHIGI